MIHRIGESKQPIIYIMLNSRGESTYFNVTPLKPSPTPPPTLFFSVKEGMHPLCPPIF